MTSVPDSPGRVIAIRPSAAASRRARRQVDALVASAMHDLELVQAGDLQAIHGPMLDLLAAVRLVVAHGLDVEQAVAS